MQPAVFCYTQSDHKQSNMLNIHEDIVISGIAGKFPESNNLDEFWNNLYNGIDMVTEIKDRWDLDSYAIPRRMGQLRALEKFDAEFLGVHGKQAENMDPRLRISLELTHEAIIDAGINPTTIRGSKTGVYLGATGEESLHKMKERNEDPSGYCATGSCLSMMSNRISFTYDLQGPSMTIDTACSSSLISLHQALLAIRSGLCEAAIVAGIHLCLDPKTTLIYTNLALTSKEGRCRSFDAAGEGYVRSEAAVVLYMCKGGMAKRSYAAIVHGKVNVDGYKTKGITFPSGIIQEKLMREVYVEAGVDPKDVDYVEAHGTGTKAGDPEEVNAIARVFCEVRDEHKPLLIGSVKSNMGHPEAASGLCQIAKIVLAGQHGIIPQNLHYNSPNPDVPALMNGQIKVVDVNTKFNGSLVGVNSFGFGGANAHILLKLTARKPPHKFQTAIPVIIPFSGRTPEVELSVEILMEKRTPELTSLLHEISRTNIPGHRFRCYGIQTQTESCIKTNDLGNGSYRPIWFIFSGMGTQYVGMAKDMMVFQAFRDSIANTIATVKEHDFDLKHVLDSEDTATLDDGLNSIVAVTAIQIALIDLMNSLDIQPDGMFGHSLGEVACAYADGCLTASETVLTSVARGRTMNQAKVPGAMASVGLTWEEATKRCPENVYPACHNSKDNVTISGPEDLITKFMNELQNEGIFARKVDSSGFAFHSRYMNDSEPFMREYLLRVAPRKTERTSRWLTTSVPEDKSDTDLYKFCSADYFVNNALVPVRFFEAMQRVPEDAIAIEVAPTNLMQAILKRSFSPTVTTIGVMSRKAPNNARYFSESVGHLYLLGHNPNFSSLYEPVECPVPAGTPMISPVIEWDHSENWFIPIHGEKNSNSTGAKIQICLNNDYDSFYSGHRIDGRVIFPATGYIWLVWSAFAKMHGRKFDKFPITFENLRFERNTLLPTDSDVSVEFVINIFPDNGDFEVFERDSAVFRGRIRKYLGSNAMFPGASESNKTISDAINPDDFMNQDDFYKELKLRGYEYFGVFRGVEQVALDGESAQIKWQDNWVGFLDTLLQFSLVQQHPHRGLYVPIRLQKIHLDPELFLNSLLEQNGSGGLLQVQNLKHVNTIKAPGLEFRGLETTTAPRKPNQVEPKISQQLFVPFMYNVPDFGIKHCLEFCLQIATDNYVGGKFTVAELFSKKLEVICNNLSESLPPKFSNANVYLVSDAEEAEVIKSVTKVSTKEMKSQKADLIIASSEDVELASEMLRDRGFVLIRNSKMGAQKNLEGLQLVAEKTIVDVQLYRKEAIKPANDKGTKNDVIYVENKSFDWVEKVKSSVNRNTKMYLVSSQDSGSTGLQGLVTCLLAEGQTNIRCFDIQDYGLDTENNLITMKFDKPDVIFKYQINLDLVFNVFQAGSWGCYCNFSLQMEDLVKPQKVGESFVNALHPGDLSTVQWIESSLVIPQEDPQELCQVHYSSLNFRDIMLATGKLSRDALPGDLAFQECVLGIEFAGDLNGKLVFGMQAAKCLATSVKLDDSVLLWEVPKTWSLAEAVTVPVAYATAFYALIIRGRMRPGETVLIHAGSGGVGQAAIAIALSHKCKVITTVSTPAKRQFLREKFPALFDDCITDSRNAPIFENDVMKLTNGRGVDIVLNSLAQDKLEASIRCLAKYGRFLEIGKFDLFNNTALGMKIFLKSVAVEGILLDDLIQGDSQEKNQVKVLIRSGIQSGVVRPLPYNLFSNNQLEEAFRFMATGKHIGKVVVSVAEESSPEILSLPRTYFHPSKSYVLVGGLGGMGLEMANWMISRGASNLIFVSRSGITTGYQRYRVKVWRDQGVKIHVDNSDVSTPQGATSVLEKAVVMGPVGGIFNLALVLKDALLQQQSAEHFKIVAKAKILGTMELDRASRTLAQKLDYFVVFSSIASSHGNAGQTNYGFANAFMERICEQRREDGLHGLAIQWGAIGEVGVLHNLMGGKDVDVAGYSPQQISSCLQVLDTFLKQNHSVVSSFVPASPTKTIETGSKTLAELVAHVLAIKDISKVKPTATLVDLGMDSLMATEIKMVLENKKGLSIPVTAVGDLTFAKLKDMESGTVKVEEIDFASELKQFTLFPMPSQAIIKMKSKCTHDGNLFVVHPLDGNVFLLERLMTEVNMTVYGFQSIKEAPLDSMDSLAAFYIEHMKKIQPAGPYQLAGYSYGAAVAFEMTIQLEKRNEIVENLILLDGCHIWPRFFTQIIMERNAEKDYVAWLLYFLCLHMPINFRQMETQLAALTSLSDRIDKCSRLLLTVYPNYTLRELDDLALGYLNRLEAGYVYNPSTKVKCRTSLIRAGAAGFDKKIGDDYQLNGVCEKPVNLLVMNGRHHCFHDRPIELGIPDMLNGIFQRSIN